MVFNMYLNCSCVLSRINEWLVKISPNTTSRAIVAIVSFLFVGFYVYFLLRNSRNEKWRRTLVTGFWTILIIGFVVHLFILMEVGKPCGPKSGLSIALMSAISSFEMFVGSTKMFDNGIQEVLFGAEKISPHTIELILLTAVYVAALITTAYLIFVLFLRNIGSRRWLKRHKPSNGDEVYVLFGMNTYVRHLIKELRVNHADALILVVDYLTEEEKSIDISLLERVRLFFSYREETVDGATIVLKAKKNLAEIKSIDICGSIGLEGLRPYLDNCINIYLLLDNQDENVAALNNLLKAEIGCKTIYCHARNDETNKEIEEAYHKENTEEQKHETDNPEPKIEEQKKELPGVVFVDSSMLSVRSLLVNEKGALPINYVKIARDETIGQNLGYVESGFKAMILGFGETGQEALAFLYEYGAFVGKNKKKAPFECHVYDSRMDKILGSYEVSHPGLNPIEAGVYYHNMEIGYAQFMDSFEKEILDTNYVVVCGGSDDINLKIVQFIMQHLGGKDTKDRFCIWVRMYNPNDIVTKTIASMGARENGCIKTFGEVEKIWLENVISDNDITEKAKDFHANYLKAKYGDNIPEDKTWDSYDNTIHDSTTHRKERLDAIRQKAQNYSNYFHSSTKEALMAGPLLDDPQSIANCIPVKYVDTLFTGDVKTRKILEYMAIGEHLRWQASHEVLGYRRGEKTDCLLKTHAFIKDYTKLEPTTQHYDWEVVRTTLEWYADKKQQKK